MTAPREQTGRFEAVAGFAPGRADLAAGVVAALTIAAVAVVCLADGFGAVARGAAEFIAFKAALVKAGLSILWDPAAGLGQPLLADPRYGALYPLNFIFYLGSSRPAFAVFASVHLAIFWFGAWALLRGARVGAVAAAGAALAAGLALFGLACFAGFGIFASLAWAPAFGWALSRRMSSGGEAATAAAGACFGLSLLAGSPTAAALGSTAAILALYIRRGPEPFGFAELSRPLLAALLLGLMIGAGQVAPAALSGQPDPGDSPALRENERLARLFGLAGREGALPRAFSVPDARWAADREGALRMISEPGFDGRVVVLEGERPAGNQPAMGNSFWPMEVVVDENDRVEILVEGKHPGWLVLIDGWAPGWRATVNGEPAEIHRAYGFFRAVRIGPDLTRVQFLYRPPEAVAGISASILGLLIAGILFFRRRLRLLWWPLWALILVLTPMVEGGTTYLPVTALRVTALALAALWALTLPSTGRVFHRTRLDFFVLGFWALTAAATAASQYLFISLYWYLNVTAFVMLFFLAVQFATTAEGAARGLFGLAALAGAIQAAWALAEVGAEVRSSAGYFNPAYLAGSLMMVSPYLLARALHEWRQSRARAAGWSALFLLFGAGLVATGSRAVVVWPVALLLAGWPGAVALLESPSRTPARARRLAAAALAAGILLLAVGLWAVPNPLRERIQNLDSDEFAFERVHIWGAALSMVRDHPLGVGPGMFRYYAYKYRFPVDHVKGGRYEKVPENAHNEYLGLAAELSPLAPLVVLLPAVWLIGVAARAGARRRDPLLSGAAAGLAAAALQAGFDANLHDHALATLAAVMAGTAVAVLGRGDGWTRPQEFRPSGVRLLQAGLVALLIVGTGANLALARSYRLALIGSAERDAGRASVRLIRAAQNSLGNAQPWRQLATLYLAIFDEDNNVRMLEKAEKAALTARRLNPADPEIYRLLAGANLALYQVTGHDDPHRAASRYLDEALRRDPANIDLFVLMARLRRVEGDRAGEIEWWKKASDLEPYDLPSRAKLVRVLAETGQTDAARRELSELIQRFQEVEKTRAANPMVFRRSYQLQRVDLDPRELSELRVLVRGLKGGGAR